MIIEQTYKLLTSQYSERLQNLTITDVRIGLFLSAVHLSDGSYGFTSTIIDSLPNCSKEKRDFGEFTPLNIKGQKVSYLFDIQKESNTVSMLRNAVLNAVSSDIIASGNYNIIPDRDPIDLLDLTPYKTITLVGAFQSYIRRLSETGNKLYVLELNEKALTDGQKQFYVPANEYKRVLPVSDIVILTGLSLVNRTMDDLLSEISPESVTVVSGPSGSVIPDIMFENNVDIIGATRITNPQRLFDLVSEGGAGYHLFRYCAQKICILGDNERGA